MPYIEVSTSRWQQKPLVPHGCTWAGLWLLYRATSYDDDTSILCKIKAVLPRAIYNSCFDYRVQAPAAATKDDVFLAFNFTLLKRKISLQLLCRCQHSRCFSQFGDASKWPFIVWGSWLRQDVFLSVFTPPCLYETCILYAWTCLNHTEKQDTLSRYLCFILSCQSDLGWVTRWHSHSIRAASCPVMQE